MEETGKEIRDPHEFEKFVLYIYLWAAYSNYRLEEEEIHLIREKLLRHKLITAEAFDKYYKSTLILFRSHNDYSCQQYIDKCIGDLMLDNTTRLKIFNDIKDIIHTERHHEYDAMQILKFRKILDIEEQV